MHVDRRGWAWVGRVGVSAHAWEREGGNACTNGGEGESTHVDRG